MNRCLSHRISQAGVLFMRMYACLVHERREKERDRNATQLLYLDAGCPWIGYGSVPRMGLTGRKPRGNLVCVWWQLK